MRVSDLLRELACLDHVDEAGVGGGHGDAGHQGGGRRHALLKQRPHHALGLQPDGLQLVDDTGGDPGHLLLQPVEAGDHGGDEGLEVGGGEEPALVQQGHE